MWFYVILYVLKAFFTKHSYKNKSYNIQLSISFVTHAYIIKKDFDVLFDQYGTNNKKSNLYC